MSQVLNFCEDLYIDMRGPVENRRMSIPEIGEIEAKLQDLLDI